MRTHSKRKIKTKAWRKEEKKLSEGGPESDMKKCSSPRNASECVGSGGGVMDRLGGGKFIMMVKDIQQQLLFSFIGVYYIKEPPTKCSKYLHCTHTSVCFYLASWFLCLRASGFHILLLIHNFFLSRIIWCAVGVASVFLISSPYIFPHFCSISNYLQHHVYALHK